MELRILNRDNFWFRFVAPNRSRLHARQLDSVAKEIARDYQHFVGSLWEDFVRESVTSLQVEGQTWKPAQSWWGSGLDRSSMEIDVLSESLDGTSLLVGSVKWNERSDLDKVRQELESHIARLPVTYQRCCPVIGVKHPPKDEVPGVRIIGPDEVLRVLL